MNYRAKSLKGAERRVRLCERRLGMWRELAEGLEQKVKICERKLELLARLAAKGPAFDNPLVAWKAEKVRDEILQGLGLNPDGTYRSQK